MTLLVCILLLLIFPSPTSAADTYSAIPPSSVSPFKTGSWTFSINDNNNTPSDWGGLSESQVFWRRLTHTQTDNKWEMKIGKGGQIFSIKTPQTGEMIPYQRFERGQWVDEAYQHTIPSTIQRNTITCDVVDGDIHQAGYYVKNDLDCDPPLEKLIPRSIYSPVYPSILSQLINIPDSFSYLTWPQHAHLPRTYSDNGMLMHQNIRDLGDGVIEITLSINKWAGTKTESVGLPHSPWRADNLPMAVISKPDGSYEEFIPNSESKAIRLKDGSTGGWFALTQGASAKDHGIAIVYGKNISSLEANTSLVYIRSPEDFLRETGHKAIVGTVNRHIPLEPGDAFYIRYYLVIGPLSKIKQYANLLASKVEIGRIETTQSQADRVSICMNNTPSLRRGCPEGQTPLFYTYRDFVRGSYPLFLLKNTTNDRHILTSDPYKISNNPTDGKTEYVDFLGWALPDSLLNQKNNHEYLKNILTDRSLYPLNNAPQEILMVKTSSQTTPSKPGDLDGDGNVNLVDYNLLVTNFGNPYTLLDYNLLVSNFGK